MPSSALGSSQRDMTSSRAISAAAASTASMTSARTACDSALGPRSVADDITAGYLTDFTPRGYRVEASEEEP